MGNKSKLKRMKNTANNYFLDTVMSTPISSPRNF